VKLSFPADPPMGLKWSPDSQYLAYIIGYPLPKETWGAWVVKADGTSGEVVLKIEQPGVGT